MKKLKFYEVELWRAYVNDNTGVEGPITDYSLCIKGYFKPTILEAEQFLADEIRALGYEGVTRIIEISEEEAYDVFDSENIIRSKIFGESKIKNKKENEKMKEEKRIVDKAITLTKDLINLLDGDLRVANLKLSQEFDDNITDLLELEEKLEEVLNNLYNPPQKTEYAIIGYDKDNDLYDELYFSTDILDVLKRAKVIEPLCDNDTLRNSKGEPYDYLEVINRFKSDVVYWRSYDKKEVKQMSKNHYSKPEENIADIILEMEELLECDMKIGRIKVDKSIFDDFVPNTYINIQFSDTKSEEIMQFTMVSEDDEGIIMEYLG